MDQTTLKSFAGIAMSVRCGKNHTHDWYSYARKSPTVDAVTPAKSLCPAITYFILRASITCGCTRRACQYSYSGKHGLNTDKALILSNLNSLCTVFIMIWNVSLVCNSWNVWTSVTFYFTLQSNNNKKISASLMFIV